MRAPRARLYGSGPVEMDGPGRYEQVGRNMDGGRTGKQHGFQSWTGVAIYTHLTLATSFPMQLCFAVTTTQCSCRSMPSLSLPASGLLSLVLQKRHSLK